MTVRELRLELEKLDQDKQIKFDCWDEDGCKMYFADASIRDGIGVVIEPY